MGTCRKEETQLKCTSVHGPIIVGAGPSGLAASACLTEKGIPSLLLEKSNCIASLWQHRLCELPFMGFPDDFPKYPSKLQFISYMESYASHFSIKPRFSHCGLWRIQTQNLEYISRWLIVATGENAEPVIPDIPGINSFHSPVIHTSVYQSGADFRNQKVLVIGCGNSGIEVCLDLCSHNASPHMVVRKAVHVLPREMFGFSTFGVAMTLLKWFPLRLVDKFLLLMAGPIELKTLMGKSPVIDAGALSQIKTGKIKVMEGVREITIGGAKFVDGQEMEFDSIILATGYKSDVPSWLKNCDFFTEEGMPRTPFPNGWKGVNGLYTVGFTRRGLFGTASDAIKIANDIAHQRL
ncbi:hypothetical protein NE237_028279 [Protea cynaroides]|uniref:Flavin-containing monooxygenase n=1 Tax=Protea cynaroides TaxID=273540 RepID=A0A9Q0GSY3_9MAGN|nr:hypothetical protein NE237_028279 [Protea cynaroides]